MTKRWYCSKHTVTVVNTAVQNRLGGNLTGFEKFRGRIDCFIVEGVK
jgi:hypothetical protein